MWTRTYNVTILSFLSTKPHIETSPCARSTIKGLGFQPIYYCRSLDKRPETDIRCILDKANRRQNDKLQQDVCVRAAYHYNTAWQSGFSRGMLKPTYL